MQTITLLTPRLKLVLQTPEEARAFIDAMDDASKAQISSDWRERLEAATLPDPWVHSFSVLRLPGEHAIGQCGFKGPPDAAGMVEIAYGIAPDQEGNGFATESARALVAYAFTHSQVRSVRAHTLPAADASQRILSKCGFRYVGDVTDPEDGLVARFETTRNTRTMEAINEQP